MLASLCLLPFLLLVLPNPVAFWGSEPRLRFLGLFLESSVAEYGAGGSAVLGVCPDS